MKRLMFVLLAVSLSTIVYGPPPAAAQSRRPDHIGRGVTDALRAQEDTLSREAARWAARSGVPRRVRQRSGAVAELVSVAAGRPTYLVSLNQEAAEVTGTSRLYPDGPLGLALTGDGMDVGVWDAGHVFDGHHEFEARVAFGDDAGVDDHATHVGGTLVAAGLRPEARGMAFGARLRSYDWNNDASEMGSEAERGLLVSNHSYGTVAGWFYGDLEDEQVDRWYWLGDASVSTSEDYAFGWYDAEAAQFDRVTDAHPYLLPVVAAGNDRADRGPASGSYRALDAGGTWRTYDVADAPHARDGGSDGFDTVSGAGVAKNVLSVGSVGVGAGRRVGPVSTFSSFGPTDDGRIKPDLVAPGEGLFSTVSSGPQAYGYSSGTSMATPAVAGAALLLQQHAFDLRGSYLTAAALKGLMLHTARDVHAPGPDYSTGWGLLDAEAAARHLTRALSDPAVLHEGELSGGATFTSVVTVDDARPVRITVSWTDPPSTRLALLGPSSLDKATPHLKNDLDVRLLDEAGNVYLPYRLDPARPAQEAVPGDNTVDPVEQIFLATAAPGTYTVVVSHKGRLSGTGPQPFALLVSGAHGAEVPVAVSHLNGEITAEEVVLTWQTRFERRGGSFVVERAPVTYRGSSRPEVGAFEVAGELPVSGGTETARPYTFSEPRALAGRYLYRLVFEGDAGRFVADEVEVHVPPPQEQAVLSSYPNPFAERATVVVDLPKTQRVAVDVFDALGRRVQHLLDGELAAGRHFLSVDATGWPPGLYFARITTPNAVLTHRMVVVR